MWTEERVGLLRSMAAEGKSYVEIAAALGTTSDAIGGKLTRLKHGSRSRGRTNMKWTPEKVAHIQGELSAGVSPYHIAESFGVKTQVIRDVMRHYKLSPPTFKSSPHDVHLPYAQWKIWNRQRREKREQV